MVGRIFIIVCIVAVAVAAVFSQGKTVIHDKKAKQMLLGRHKMALQWISWDYFGTATVSEKGGLLVLRGRQDGRNSSNFVSVDGIITEVHSSQFVLKGKVVTQIDHINGGRPCERSGTMTFRITGTRKYWRLQQMDNPCDVATDYVDIFFR